MPQQQETGKHKSQIIPARKPEGATQLQANEPLQSSNGSGLCYRGPENFKDPAGTRRFRPGVGSKTGARPIQKHPARYSQTGTQRFRTLLDQCRRVPTTIRSLEKVRQLSLGFHGVRGGFRGGAPEEAWPLPVGRVLASLRQLSIPVSPK